MTPEQSPYPGSQLHSLSWAAGDVAYLEIDRDPMAEIQWVKEYATGRKEFSDRTTDYARQFNVSGMPAEAVIASRVASEIPWRGGEFMHSSEIVTRAMGMEDVADGFRATHRAMQEAFDTPSKVKNELQGISAQGRQVIEGREVQAWAEAANFFSNRGEFLLASVGVLELGNAYEQRGQVDEALYAYNFARQLLKRGLKVATQKGGETEHTAEVDELNNYVVVSLSSVIRLSAAKGRVKGKDKQVLQAAVYELDDLGLAAVVVQEGYELLASNASFREKRYYKREAAAIAGELAVAKFFANGGEILLGGPKPRKDRRHRRPLIAT